MRIAAALLLATSFGCNADAPRGEEGVVLWSWATEDEIHCEAGFADSLRETPVGTAPRILNPEAVRSALESLDTHGSPGVIRPWLLIDSMGNVGRLLVDERGGSGDLGSDTLLGSVAPLLRFAPATWLGESTCVWIRLPFRVGPNQP